jgi:hypothetical protein
MGKSSFDKDGVLGPISTKFVEEMVLPLYPGLQIKLNTKPDWLYKFLSFWGKMFNPKLVNQYLTVVGTTIWVPESFKTHDDISQLASMMHEATHLYDQKRLTPVPYFLLYASPQILAVLALLSFGAFYDLFWTLWLLCLLFILPLPSPGRAWVEFRGYQMNMMLQRKRGDNLVAAAAWYRRQFTGPAYFFMWPFPRYVERKLMEKLEEKDSWAQRLSKWVDDNTDLPF